MAHRRLPFFLGKSRLVLTHQGNWVISSKELEAAKLSSEVVSQAAVALSHLNCSIHLWTDSQVVLKWITNRDLHFVRFVERHVDKILSFFAPETRRYINTSTNPTNVGTRKAKPQPKTFQKQELNAAFLKRAFSQEINYVQ